MSDSNNKQRRELLGPLPGARNDPGGRRPVGGVIGTNRWPTVVIKTPGPRSSFQPKDPNDLFMAIDGAYVTLLPPLVRPSDVTIGWLDFLSALTINFIITRLDLQLGPQDPGALYERVWEEVFRAGRELEVNDTNLDRAKITWRIPVQELSETYFLERVQKADQLRVTPSGDGGYPSSRGPRPPRNAQSPPQNEESSPVSEDSARGGAGDSRPVNNVWPTVPIRTPIITNTFNPSNPDDLYMPINARYSGLSPPRNQRSDTTVGWLDFLGALTINIIIERLDENLDPLNTGLLYNRVWGEVEQAASALNVDTDKVRVAKDIWRNAVQELIRSYYVERIQKAAELSNAAPGSTSAPTGASPPTSSAPAGTSAPIGTSTPTSPAPTGTSAPVGAPPPASSAPAGAPTVRGGAGAPTTSNPTNPPNPSGSNTNEQTSDKQTGINPTMDNEKAVEEKMFRDDMKMRSERDKTVRSNLRPFLASAGIDSFDEQDDEPAQHLKMHNILMGQYKPAGWPNGGTSNPLWMGNMANEGLRYSGKLFVMPDIFNGGTLTEGATLFGSHRNIPSNPMRIRPPPHQPGRKRYR
jgi:hypothetical protein